MKCSKCGHNNNDQLMFCEECGTRLKGKESGLTGFTLEKKMKADKTSSEQANTKSNSKDSSSAQTTINSSKSNNAKSPLGRA